MNSGHALLARSNREARAFGPRSTEPVATSPDTTEVEVRAFAAPVDVNENPVTGSFNASLAQWLIADGHAPSAYVASQGACLGRAGRVHIERDATGQVWVGRRLRHLHRWPREPVNRKQPTLHAIEIAAQTKCYKVYSCRRLCDKGYTRCFLCCARCAVSKCASSHSLPRAHR